MYNTIVQIATPPARAQADLSRSHSARRFRSSRSGPATIDENNSVMYYKLSNNNMCTVHSVQLYV